jgi:hypothetical protein
MRLDFSLWRSIDFDHLTFPPGAMVGRNDDRAKPGIEYSDCASGRAVQQMQGHAIPPNRRSPLNNN